MIISERMRVALAYAGPIVLGLLISLAGSVPWILMARLNATVHPEIPWAAVATLLYLAVYIAWLNGAGPPAKWRAARRYRLRLLRPDSNGWSKDGIGVTLSLMAVIAVLAALWILMGAPDHPPDLKPYPTTAYRVSIVVMGALVSGVTEEVAFRGYMQRGLERFGGGHAIVVTALVFTLAHLTHGLTALLLLGPGIFFAGVIYGMLARHTGSILPGMLMHFLGDLAFTYFGILGGDWRLLIAG